MFEEAADSSDPGILIQVLADKFGFPVRSGDLQSRFILGTMFDYQQQEQLELIKVFNIPGGRMVGYHFTVTLSETPHGKMWIVRMAFAIDLIRFFEYVKERLAGG